MEENSTNDERDEFGPLHVSSIEDIPPIADAMAAAVENVCDTCSMPAIEVDGVWRHAEAKDDVFHAIFFGGAR